MPGAQCSFWVLLCDAEYHGVNRILDFVYVYIISKASTIFSVFCFHK